MKLKFLALALILLASFSNAATISGTLFEWYTLEPLEAAIVEIDTVPKQTIVTGNGEYSFNVNPGTYNLQAQYYVDNRLVYLAEESITIKEDGVFTVDLIMFPALEEPEFLYDDFEEVGVLLEELEDVTSPGNNSDLIGGVVLVAFAFVLILWGAKKISKSVTGLETERISIEEKYVKIPKEILGKKEPEKNEEETKGELNKELNETLDILKRYGGRMTQKDLREKLPFGEAKTSLIVAELEEMGKIKKFKKGRGNILVLKE